MQRTKPPFRADEVGSLLRPQRIKEARAKLEKGEISPEELRKADIVIDIQKKVAALLGRPFPDLDLKEKP